MKAYMVMVTMETSMRDTYRDEYNGVAYADKGLAEIVKADAERELADNSNFWGADVEEIDVPDCIVFV